MTTRKWLAGAALGLLLITTFASARDYISGSKIAPTGGNPDLQGYYRTSDSTVQKFEGSGGLYTTTFGGEDRDQVYQAAPIIQTKLYNSGGDNTKAFWADSSAPISTRGWNHMALAILPTFKDSLGILRGVVAIQIRGHGVQSGDSLSTFPWLRWRTPAGGFVAQSATTWPDTAGGFMPPDTMTASAAGRGEFLVTFEVHQSAPRGAWINLVDARTGEPWSAPYTSVRVRFVQAFGSTSGTGNYATLTANQASVLLTLSLYGWR